MADRKAVIVGISGCSSSGKTTLARLLRDIFPNAFILHEDDFYKQDDEIPIKAGGLADWDCPEAISLPDMERSLAYIRSHGALPVSSNPHLSRRANHGSTGRRGVSLDEPSSGACCAAPSSAASLAPSSRPSTALSTAPSTAASEPPSLTSPQPDLFSKEDKNSVGQCPVPDATIAAIKAKVQAWAEPGQPGYEALSLGGGRGLQLCFLDGFLLYCDAMRPAMDLIDVRLFLRVSRAKATNRREARDGYVTLEGFWQDPPGYMDKIVWPNYVEEHKWLFENADVEGKPDRNVLAANGILTQLDKGMDVDMATTLEWAVDTLMDVFEKKTFA